MSHDSAITVINQAPAFLLTNASTIKCNSFVTEGTPLLIVKRLHLYSRSGYGVMCFCHTFVTEGTSVVYSAHPLITEINSWYLTERLQV